MGNALSVNHASAAHRRLVRVLTVIGAVLLGSTSHGAAAAVVPPELVPTPATMSADLFFSLTPPDPIHVSTFGFHDLVSTSGEGGRLLVDSALFPSPFVFASVPDIRGICTSLMTASTPLEAGLAIAGCAATAMDEARNARRLKLTMVSERPMWPQSCT